MEKMDEIWAEEDLIKRFYLKSKVKAEGEPRRSREISNWILKGLKQIRLGGKRFFREEDIVAFFEECAKTDR